MLAPKVSQELTKLTGFVEDMDIHGRKASARVVSKGVVAANEIVARHLDISKGTRVMRIQRVRLADSVPMSFDETYLPLDIGKKIVRNDRTAHAVDRRRRWWNTPVATGSGGDCSADRLHQCREPPVGALASEDTRVCHLALTGGLLGLIVAVLGVRLLLAKFPESLPT